MLDWLSADGKLLLVTRALRTFAYGYLGVVLALYLEALGLDAVGIGLVITLAIAGSAAMTILWSLLADRVGRRRTVGVMALLMAAGGLLFALATGAGWLALGALSGTISATSSEVGAFITVEQAILPQTAPDSRRTFLFALYNAIGNLAGAVGAIAAGLVPLFVALGLRGADAYRPLFVVYALVGLLNLALFLRLSDQVEVARIEGAKRLTAMGPSRGRIARLALLFGVDAFAGGFVATSIVSYWFHLRFGLGAGELAPIFFAANALSGLSFFAASWVARRVGLLNTMVFTHLPSNLLLMLVPLMPSASAAILTYLARTSISQMDVPTRQSYTMAVVDPSERTAAAGITNVARSVATAISPSLAGYALAVAATGLPFYIGGALKIVYDLALFTAFRGVRPPEERGYRGEREDRE
ncbi:MAG TPA: MFS transporter [Candidatus Limnocylindria bacterium]|nr:MFS transporter [Candidatus Limnocylindria bacterium]